MSTRNDHYIRTQTWLMGETDFQWRDIRDGGAYAVSLIERLEARRGSLRITAHWLSNRSAWLVEFWLGDSIIGTGMDWQIEDAWQEGLKDASTSLSKTLKDLQVNTKSSNTRPDALLSLEK